MTKSEMLDKLYEITFAAAYFQGYFDATEDDVFLANRASKVENLANELIDEVKKEIRKREEKK